MTKFSDSKESFLEGGGQTGALIRSKNWNETPLGPPENWPQSLKICVRIILTSRQPMFVWWGKELINIYNDAYISILGGKHPESLGQPARIVWDEIWHEVGPRANTVMNENTGTYDEALLLLMERNGYTEETYYTFSYSPVPGEDGTTHGIICANTDDTQRIIGGRQLQTLRELAKGLLNINNNTDIYQRTIEALNNNPQDFPFVVLYEVSDDGKKLKLVGKLPNDLPEAMRLPDIDLELQAAELRELNETVVSGKVTEVLDITQRFGTLKTTVWDRSPDKALLIPIVQNNRKIPFAVMGVGVNPYRLLDENYLSFFNLVSDQISTALTNAYAFKQERKRAESLAEIDKAKTLFFSNISHEFRTPLTLMLGPLEQVLNHADHIPEADLFHLEVAHRNAIRLLRLVNALLDFSRIESGRIKAQFQAVDLGQLTSDIASSFRSLMENAGLEFDVKVDNGLTAYVDTEMWEKIVLNLLSNAFKYTLKGKIRIVVRTDQNLVSLAISDTGSGIPSEEMQHLFKRFHRIKNSGGRSYEGSGIGLSLVKELVKLHGGTINATSNEGNGSEFTVTIPLGKDHIPADQIMKNTGQAHEILPNYFAEEAERLIQKSANAEPVSDTKKEVVLVVEDNPDMQEYISNLLQTKYEVKWAGNGREALDIVSKSPPNLIISDVMMPVMDGIEMLRILKNDSLTKRIPVLMLSARAGEEARIEGYELGADDYLIKPFSTKELMARVKSQIKIANSRNHVENQLQNLFHQAPVAISILKGPQYHVEMANEKMLALWGKNLNDVHNKPLFEGIPEAAEQGYEQLLHDVYHTGKAFVAEEMPLTLIRNGVSENIYVKFVYEALFDEDGKVFGIIALADEITERVLGRKKIENSELRYKLAIDAASIGSFELDIRKPEFLYTERLAEIFGLDKKATMLQSDFVKNIHPDDYNIRLNAHQLAAKTGVLFYEARVIWPDESIHWIRVNGKIIFENGSPSKIYGTALDITDHKTQSAILEQKVAERTKNLIQKNEELKKSEERYQRMTEEVQDYAILLLDKSGTILNWNKGAENIKGYKDYEIIGKNITTFYRPEDQQRKLPQQLIREAYETGRAMHEGYRVRKDGTVFWGSVTLTALHNKKNEVIGFSKVTRDLTERKNNEDKLYRYTAELEFQNKELEQFAYIASHDLQEPLRKIQMFTDMLEKNYQDPELASRYFGKINSSAARMTELIKAVLNYSRLSKDDQFVEKVDLNEILNHVLIDFELLIDEKQAVITSETMPKIKGITLQISQLFSNLIGNSLKFSEDKPLIQIRSRIVNYESIPFDTNLKPESNYVELIFQDQGIGFDQQYAAKIFTIFQRLHDRSSYSGTGIGLALCKRIVENHSGYINVKSNPGKGTAFYIYLPMD